VQVEALYGGPEGRELGLSKVVAAEISNASGGPNVAPLPDEEHSDEHAYSCVVRSGSGSRSGERIGYYEAQVSEPFRALFADAVRRGNARFSLPLRFLDRDAQTATMPDGADLAEVHLLEPIGGERGLQTEAPQEEVADGARGAKTVLAVRVLAPDGSPPETADEIAAALFGIADDPDLLPTASVAAQYAALSHGQLSLLPAVGPGISNGVAEIQIDMNVRGSKIQSELSSHLLEKTAQALGASVDEVADRIVYCLPTGSLLQGRDTWTAYTYLFQHVRSHTVRALTGFACSVFCGLTQVLSSLRRVVPSSERKRCSKASSSNPAVPSSAWWSTSWGTRSGSGTPAPTTMTMGMKAASCEA
jgi:hypothetical protein